MDTSANWVDGRSVLTQTAAASTMIEYLWADGRSGGAEIGWVAGSSSGSGGVGTPYRPYGPYEPY